MPDTPNRFTTSIDFTSRAQQQVSQEKAIAAFTEPESPLPDATTQNVSPRLQAAIKAAGWNDLMPVQAKAIPYILEGRDLIVQSRTGSGKTGAFALPLFEIIDYDQKAAQALILSPTRELAKQIFEEFEKMRRGPERADALQAVLVYGGVKYGPQTKALHEGAQVVIGTPGRMLDHLQRGTFNLQNLKVLVLDEADEMLSMGFWPAMQQLRRYLPNERQSYMFSATMPPRVRSLGQNFLTNPSFLSLSAGHESVEEITYTYYVVDAMEKDRALARLIEMENPESAIIFANTKRDVEYVATFLRNYGYDAAEISGDLAQRDREAVMDRIRKGTLRFLVATDVAARGIDISDLSHVFMYDVPQDPEYFIHRSGRTARAGKSGTAIILTTRPDQTLLQRIAARYGITTLEKKLLPTPEEVEMRVTERMTEVLEEQFREKSNLERERLQRFLPLVNQLAAEEPEILAMLVDEMYHQRLHVPESSAEASPAPEPAQQRPERKADSNRRSRPNPRRNK
ncbi:MAG TPA: DEAD/DEAH box helicase [Rhodothermales bacterium]|nr:DEAD/DEAH box helicase [Rhodothermales bacterium]